MLLGILDIRLNSEIQTCVFVYGLDITYASREIIQAINISIRALPHCLTMYICRHIRRRRKQQKIYLRPKMGNSSLIVPSSPISAVQWPIQDVINYCQRTIFPHTFP